MSEQKKILIIEDEEMLLSEMAEYLGFEGFETFLARNGREGKALALEFEPDLILCDIMMPEMDGFQLIEELKSVKESFSKTPFVFISALGSRDEIREGMLKGADDYLPKPFTPDELLQTIQSRLEKAKIVQTELNKIVSENNQLKLELSENNRDIIGSTLSLIKKSNNLTEISEYLQKQIEQTDSEDLRRTLKFIWKKLDEEGTINDNWTIFQLEFNQRHPELISKFTSAFSMLTQYELTLIAAIYTGLNTVQIADLLNISKESVRKSRYRLKKRLGLGNDENLIDFIHNFPV